MLKKVFVLAATIFLFAASAQCLDLNPDYMGVSAWIGEEFTFSTRMSSDSHDYNWRSAIMTFGKYLPNKKYRVNVEPAIGVHKAWGEYTKRGISIELKLWLLRDFKIPYVPTGNFYLGIGGGLLHLSPKNDQPEIANSGLLGTIACCAGLKYPLPKLKNYSLIVEGRVDHISDALRKCDGGRNYFGGVLGIVKEF